MYCDAGLDAVLVGGNHLWLWKAAAADQQRLAKFTGHVVGAAFALSACLPCQPCSGSSQSHHLNAYPRNTESHAGIAQYSCDTFIWPVLQLHDHLR